MGVELSENGNEVVIRIGENGVEKENLELSIFLQSENTLNFNTEDSQAYF